MLTVHHLGVSQSERIVWLCEELGIPYELIRYSRDPQTRMAPAEYKALHPLGTAPIITDGDLVMPESAAIMEYIIHKYGGGRLALGPEHPDYANYLFWFHFANGSFMPAEMGCMLALYMGGGESPLLSSINQRAATVRQLIEERLGEAPYLAGQDFTAADIINLFPLTTMRAFTRRSLSGFPNTAAYLQRIAARPAYQAAMAKGDPGMTPFLE